MPKSDEYLRDTIDALRRKLLDLTSRNPLLSFKHSARSGRHVRVVDELPEQLYERLGTESGMRFKSLGQERDEPDDEKTILFRRALDAAKREDPDYLQKMSEQGDNAGERAAEALEQELRAKLRERIGMPARMQMAGRTVADVARSRGLDPSFDLPASPTTPGNGSEKHADSAIQTLLFDEAMERVLARIREKVRLSISEAGVNPLFCVFGFLEWYEDDNSQTPRHAPLLVYPLDIDRKLVRGHYDYTVRTTGESAILNPALAARLKRDFDIILPPFGEDDLPEKYLTLVQKVIERHKGWKVRRWITIGLFSFARIAMYYDLAPELWESQGGLHDHDVLKHLLTGGTQRDEGSNETDSDDDSEASADTAELAVPLIADADSTQLAAIRDVLRGRSLVIEGPPGTGKSQTITNIIAAALAAGKTVLFLAEKMAALNVVKHRLAQAKLDQFCLELHSTKAGRMETSAAFARRLSLPRAKNVGADLDATLAHLRKMRTRLSTLVEALAQPAGKLGVSAQQLLWKCHTIRIQTASLPSEIDEIAISDADQLTAIDVGRRATVCEQLENARATIVRSYGSIHQHPWRGIARHDTGVIQAEDVIRRVESLSAAADGAEKISCAAVSLTSCPIESIAQLESLGMVMAIPPADPSVNDEIVARMADPQTLAALERFSDDVAIHALLCQRVAASFQDAGAAAECSVDVLRSLAKSAEGAAIPDTALSNVKNVTDTRCRMAEAWEATNALLARIASCVGWTTAPTPLSDRALFAAMELAAEAGSAAIARRTTSVVAIGASETLRRGMEQAQRLRARREALSSQYSLEGIPDSPTLRKHATSLRSAPFGPFALFSAGWWRARTAYKGLCRIPLKAARSGMAAALDDLASLKDDISAFAADNELLDCAGSTFNGVDSNLALLFGIAQWADLVRALLPATNDVNTHLQRFLLSDAPDRVDALARTAGDPSIASLRAALAMEGTQTVADRARMAREQAVSANAALAVVERIKLRPECQLSSVASLADDMAQSHALCESLDACEVAASALGSKFQGHRTVTTELLACAQHVRAVVRSGLAPQLKQWLLQTSAVQRLADLRPVAEQASIVFKAVEIAVEQLRQTAPVDFTAWIGVPSPLDARAGELRDHADRCIKDPEGLHTLIDDARWLHEIRQEGLGSLLDLFERRNCPIHDLGKAARRVIYQSLARTIIATSPALANFTGDRHEGNRSEFRDFDRKLLLLRQAKIAADLAMRLVDGGCNSGPKSGWSGLALIVNETNKQKRHIPIRDLLDRAGDAAQQLMPCFMMSPLSVAQYLKPDRLTFDLVIMDEASQIRPEDAIGAIARTNQIVIVGDPKQLPPTNFFMGSDTTEPDDEDTTAADEPSILDQAITILPSGRRLKWHYRSRHGSLIAFSNKEFYDNQLIIFPSPYHDHSDFGVKYVHVSEGVYRSSLNLPEAQHVAAAAIEYAARHPERSLGIVTLNQAQSEVLTEEIDRLATQHEEFEAWRRKQETSLEPFFVKNLENVQGDERDTIFISTVYGRDEQGNFHQRFGPINNPGGHRRLNVLFTRAKCQTVIFSSMDHADIRADENAAWGVRALKGYLKYAKDGILDSASETGRPPDSDFEVAVADALGTLGLQAVPQVGVAGYFIDIGVRHPERPGEFVLGVECDGAMYHCTRSARDRDRLRQEILERLNWRIHRIWSLDWYRNPKREVERLQKAVRESVAAM